MRAKFFIHAFQEDDRHRLALTGELDLATVPAFERAVNERCTSDASELVLDLSALEFIDSTGLRAILMAQSRCEEFMCDFCIVPGEAQVQRVFEISGLLDGLPFCDPDREAPGVTPTQLWPERR